MSVHSRAFAWFSLANYQKSRMIIVFHEGELKLPTLNLLMILCHSKNNVINNNNNNKLYNFLNDYKFIQKIQQE